ncbi:hypothetical protein [Streptococcus gallolyticus]|uniref:hypothetical protein n=1 Tax=Streptococcus gallolyticus TaxID=315405 RepID=UPI002283A8D9|nr:hypothetical protein [Streptococcus gallolyticus]MCY7166558.1 hypothetical protein [Streptococcus gallolyticus subsp. gallolyticus]MCY7183939.1 hypothetical protein [Streptococcus gallolyticus subsp. gallolyticus]
MSVLGFISKASETVDQLAIGIGELSHLTVEGLEMGVDYVTGHQTPQWIKDDITGATNNLLAASEFTDSLLALDAEAWGAVGKELGKIGTDFVTAVKTGDDYALGGYVFDVATLVGPASVSKLKYVDEASALTKLAETSEVASTVGKVEEGVKVSKFDKLFGKLNKKNIKSVTFNNTKTINKIDFVVTDINDSKALSIPKQLNGYEEYANFLKEVGDSNLSLEEKVENLQKAYYRIQDKTDIQVPIHAKYVKSIENGQIEYYWLGKLGFQENTIQAITRESGLPDIWERSGYMGGGNFSDLPQTGPYTNSEKAIPYIPNPAASHTGTFNTKTYFEKIDAINDGDLEKLNSILKEESIKPFSNSEFKKLKFKYENYVDYTAKSLGIPRENVLYGVHGKAAAWHELAGGAEQIVTPFNGFIMENLGILGE